MGVTSERVKGADRESKALAVYQEVRNENDFLGFARRFVFDEDHRVARNALWVLTKASDDELEQLKVLSDEWVDLAMHTDNSSVRRLALNVIERWSMGEDDLRTDFLDFCLEHMSDVEEYPGIQSICMKLAFRMCQFYPELMEELKCILQSMEIDYYKPAVRSVRNRILSGKLK